MTNRIGGDEYRTTLVCIDSYENNIPNGYFFNPYLPEGKSFCGITQFLLAMEQTLDNMDFPQSFSVTRSFVTPPELKPGTPGLKRRTGVAATFAVRILFRQNASWQGSITWLEGKQEQSFRSVLELILLMDNALNYTKAS